MSDYCGPLIIDVASTALTDEDREVLLHPLVAGIILFTRNYESPAQVSALCAELRGLPRGQPLLITVDHEGGRVQRFRAGFTDLPAAASLGDAAAARRQAYTIAAELRAVGVDLSFAPVLDIDRGRGTVIGDRALGVDADAVSALGVAWIEGMRAGGMAACGKHFPGHGGVAADSHLELPVDPRTLAQIRAEDMVPFARSIAAGLPAVMMAHVSFPAVDATPASFSHRWIDEVLRGELAFDGAIVCDDLSMAGAAVMGDALARAEAALAAGCDLLPVCNNRAAVYAILDGLPAACTVPVHRVCALQGR